MASDEREPLLTNTGSHGSGGFTVEQNVTVEAAIPTTDPHDPAEGAALRLGEEGGVLLNFLLVSRIFG